MTIDAYAERESAGPTRDGPTAMKLPEVSFPTTPDHPEASPRAGGMAALLVCAILAGCAFGLWAPDHANRLSGSIDRTLMLLIGLLFFDLRLGAVARALKNVRFLALAWSANFLIVPALGFVIASLILPNHPLLFIGLMLYFLAPCTDWFLGFTHMARGDTELGAALIPVNLITQLLLFPLWLWLLTQQTELIDFAAILDTLLHWFLLPLLAVQAVRTLLERMLPSITFETLTDWVGRLIPVALAALIFQIFAVNIGVMTTHLEGFALITLAVFLFFCATYALGEGLTRLARLTYPQRALLTMTLSARNAPLMLVITVAALPDEPLILAALAIGMLIEIPHLTALKQLSLRQYTSGSRVRNG